MWWIAFPATVAAVGGFLASVLPGIGLTPLFNSRLRLAAAATPVETIAALMGVMLTALLVSLSGVLRLVMFAVGVLALGTELLTDLVSDKQLSTTTNKEVGSGR